MSFRKRNVGLTGPSDNVIATKYLQLPTKNTGSKAPPGVRPSPLDGRPTISSGTESFDELQSGHAGLPLGSCIMVEENGTTDFAGALLRYYAAEGAIQRQKVHVVGVGDQWGRELPGLIGSAGDGTARDAGLAVDKEKMKIAWRYERLGEFGAGARASPTPNRNPPTPASEEPDSTAPTVFRHSFDLTKRLTLPTESAISFIPVPSNTDPSISPYDFVLEFLTNALATTTTSKIHRFIMPTLLSPALYPPDACNSTFLLPFLHSLRSILRIHCHRLSVMLTIPLSLHPRSTGLVCWIEQLCDGVFELAPFPHRIDLEPPSSGVKKTEEKPQGMVKVHKLPVLTEKGGGGGGADDLAFSLSRKRFTIKPYSLPPLEGDNEAQRGDAEGGQMKVDIEF